MIIILSLVLGFGVGFWRAKQRGGNRMDQLQWGTAHAIAFGLAGVALVILARNLGLG